MKALQFSSIKKKKKTHDLHGINKDVLLPFFEDLKFKITTPPIGKKTF